MLRFPHITRSLQGVVLNTHRQVKQLIERMTTKTGLKVFAYILNRL